MAAFTIDEIAKVTKAQIFQRGKESFVTGISIDTRTIQPKELFIALIGENFDGHNFVSQAIIKGAQAVIISDAAYAEKINTDITVLLVKDTRKSLEDIAHFHRMRFNIPVIGVTGSNGKTTTKDMITAVLKNRFRVTSTQKNFNNEIGLCI